jgi:hypothetical protein
MEKIILRESDMRMNECGIRYMRRQNCLEQGEA